MARSNRVAVPEAKQSLKNFKTEVANSMNITLNDGYNGDISALRCRQDRRPDG